MKPGILGALGISAMLFGSAVSAQGTKAAQATVPTKNPAPAITSNRAAVTSDSAHTYDTDALRYESRWGSADIKRGSSGTVIGTVGWFRDYDVEKLVANSPNAVAEARSFKTDNFRGSLGTSVGALTFVTGLAVASNSSNNAASPILIIAGAGGVAWGVYHLQLGYSALSRALWWYNRDLTR
jgi:hypothetical protein